MARGRAYISNAQRRLAVARARLQKGGTARTARGRQGARGLRPPAPMPWDSTAQRESGELRNESADARAALAASYDRAQRELGFGVGTGDPYSRAAENRDQLAANQRGIRNTAGMQLYSGSSVNAQASARKAYDKTQKGLEDSFAQAQADYNQGTARTARDEALGLAAIKEGALSRAAATDPEPLAVGSGSRVIRRGRGRLSGPGRDGRNVRRPAVARRNNAQARALNARINRARGRRV